MTEILSIFPSNDTMVKLLTGGLLGAFATWLLNWWRERRSVNSALSAEVDRICLVISGQLSFIRGEKEALSEIVEGEEITIQEHAKGVTWLPFGTPIWDKLVDKLGLVGPRRAGEMAKFFGFFGFINEFLALRGEYEKLGRADEFNGRYILLLKDQLERRPNL